MICFIGELENLTDIVKKQKIEQIDKVRLAVRDDINILSKRIGISKEEAAKRYQDDLDWGGIKPNSGNEQYGLNKVVGYSLEKLELIKNAVVPIIKLQKAKLAGEDIPKDVKIPNGILLYGQNGTGKSHMVKSLLEHIDYKCNFSNYNNNQYKKGRINVVTLDKPWLKGDTDENIDTVWNAFEKAQDKGKHGEHTFILINNLDQLMSAKNAELLKTEVAYRTQHPAEDGVTWVVTTNNIKNMPKWMFDPKRTSIVMPIGKIQSDAEVSAVFSHFIEQVNRKDKSDHDVILDYAKENNLNFIPAEIKDVVNRADLLLKETKDYSSYDKGDYIAPIKNENLKEAIWDNAINRRSFDIWNNRNLFENRGGWINVDK